MGDKLNPASKEGGGIVSIKPPDVVYVFANGSSNLLLKLR